MSTRRTTAVITGWALMALVGAGCGARVDPPVATVAGNATSAVDTGTHSAANPSTEVVGPDGAAPAADTAAGSTQAATPAGGASTPQPGSATGPVTAAGASGSAAGPRGSGAGSASTPGATSAAGPKSPAASGAAGGDGSNAAGSLAKTGEPADAVRVSGPSSQGVTDTEIKVGVLAPLSGAAGFLGELELDAVKAYLSDVNAKGGVRGRKYRIISADTRMESPTEATAARRLVEEDKVFALIGTFGDSLSPYAASRGIPTMVFGLLPPVFSSKYPNVYPVGFNNVEANLQMAYALTQVLKLPVKSVAFLYETANVPWGDWAEYAKKAWEHFGVQVKSMDRFNISDGDCTQLMLKIRNLNVDFWQIAQSLGWPLCQAAMARANYTPPYGRGGPYTDDVNFVGQVGQASDGIYAMSNGVQIKTGTPWPYDPTGKAPAVADFVRSMQQFSPKSADDIGLEGIWAQDFWTSAKLLNEAISRQTDALTWKGVNAWIQSQRNWNGGLIGPANFDPKCKSGTSLWLFQFKWNGSRLVETDWQPYGGVKPLPVEAKNAVFPGAGHCYLTAIADAKL